MKLDPFGKIISGCYSLKNTRFPEYVFNTDAGVCSLDA